MAEMIARLAQLSGSHLEGMVQLTESAVNDVLAVVSARGTTVPTVRLLDGNQIEVRYGIIHARAQLPAGIIAGPAPRMTVALASTIVAWALRAALGQPFLEFHGKLVTIHLAAVPALASLRALWPHLKMVGFSTAPGVLRVQVGLAIDNGVTHG